MNIFLTGATGFIGKYTARRLLEAGHTVRALARDQRRLDGLLPLGIQPVPGSLSDPAALREGMCFDNQYAEPRRSVRAAQNAPTCDLVVHLAGKYSMWDPHPDTFWQVNAEGTRSVLQAALESGARRVIYVSTVAVWGKPDQAPFNEDTPRGAHLLSEYARSKAEGERLAWEFCQQNGLALTVLYPGIVLGAGDDRASGQYIRLLVFRRTPSTIFHNSPATYVAARDVAEAVRLAAESPASIGRGYLIGKETLRGREFAAMVSQLSGVKPPPLRLPDWFIRAASYPFTALAALTGQPPLWTLSIDAGRTLQAGFHFDGSRAERELGLCYTPIRAALREAIEDYRKEKANGHH